MSRTEEKKKQLAAGAWDAAVDTLRGRSPSLSERAAPNVHQAIRPPEHILRTREPEDVIKKLDDFISSVDDLLKNFVYKPAHAVILEIYGYCTVVHEPNCSRLMNDVVFSNAEFDNFSYEECLKKIVNLKNKVLPLIRHQDFADAFNTADNPKTINDLAQSLETSITQNITRTKLLRAGAETLQVLRSFPVVDIGEDLASTTFVNATPEHHRAFNEKVIHHTTPFDPITWANTVVRPDQVIDSTEWSEEDEQKLQARVNEKVPEPQPREYFSKLAARSCQVGGVGLTAFSVFVFLLAATSAVRHWADDYGGSHMPSGGDAVQRIVDRGQYSGEMFSILSGTEILGVTLLTFFVITLYGLSRLLKYVAAVNEHNERGHVAVHRATLKEKQKLAMLYQKRFRRMMRYIPDHYLAQLFPYALMKLEEKNEYGVESDLTGRADFANSFLVIDALFNSFSQGFYGVAPFICRLEDYSFEVDTDDPKTHFILQTRLPIVSQARSVSSHRNGHNAVNGVRVAHGRHATLSARKSFQATFIAQREFTQGSSAADETKGAAADDAAIAPNSPYVHVSEILLQYALRKLYESRATGLNHVHDPLLALKEMFTFIVDCPHLSCQQKSALLTTAVGEDKAFATFGARNFAVMRGLPGDIKTRIKVFVAMSDRQLAESIPITPPPLARMPSVKRDGFFEKKDDDDTKNPFALLAAPHLFLLKSAEAKPINFSDYGGDDNNPDDNKSDAESDSISIGLE